ncbi:MAG: FliH/SctL family protein [Pseudomonadota bacterium]
MEHNKKFLFDLNNFDDPNEVEEVIIEEEIEVEPPPPTFSEDEMEAAKAIAESKGRQAGIEEEKSKRAEYVAQLVQKMTENFETLFAAESYREKQYEEDSVRLASELIDQLSPVFVERFGSTELKKTLKSVLSRLSNQKEIRIEVHPDDTADIDQFLENMWDDQDNAPRYKVISNADMQIGGCEMTWADGGMVRNPQEIAVKMKEEIETLLDNGILENIAVKNPVSADAEITNSQKDAIKES